MVWNNDQIILLGLNYRLNQRNLFDPAGFTRFQFNKIPDFDMFSISNFKPGKQIIQGVTEDKSKDKDTSNQYDNNRESGDPPDFERNQDTKRDNEDFNRVSTAAVSGWAILCLLR